MDVPTTSLVSGSITEMPCSISAPLIQYTFKLELMPIAPKLTKELLIVAATPVKFDPKASAQVLRIASAEPIELTTASPYD